MNDNIELSNGNSPKENLERMIGEIKDIQEIEPSFTFKHHTDILVRNMEEGGQGQSFAPHLADALLFIVQGKVNANEAQEFLEKMRIFRAVAIDPYQSLSYFTDAINRPPKEKSIPFHFGLSQHARSAQEVITIRKCLAQLEEVPPFLESEYETLLLGLRAKLVSVASHFATNIEEIATKTRRELTLNNLLNLLTDLRDKTNISFAEIPGMQEQRMRMKELLLDNVETTFQQCRATCHSDDDRRLIDEEKSETIEHINSIFAA